MDSSATLRTQAALANAAGLAQSSVSKMLLGQSDPSLSTAAAVASALGITLDELVPGGPAPTSKRTHDESVHALSPAAARRLTDIQRAMFSMAARLIVQKKLTDRDCLNLMQDWMTRLDPEDESSRTLSTAP